MNSQWPPRHFVALPHNTEVEQAFLGALLLNNEAYGLVANAVSERDFFEPIHGMIYAEMARQIGLGKKVNPVTLKDAFPDAELVNGVTVRQYLARLAANATKTINAPDYAERIRTLSEMRKIIAVGDDLRRAADDTVAPDEALRKAWEYLDDTRESSAGSVSQRADLATLIDRARAERANPSDAKPFVVTTGFADLDRDLGGGWRGGRLYVIAGRPGMGKTVFLCSSARRSSRYAGAAIYSLEIDGDEIRARLTADETARAHISVPYRDIVAGDLSDAQWGAIERAETKLATLPLRIDASGGLSIGEIEARARVDSQRLAAVGKRLGVVCIDYLGLVRASNRYRGNKVDELGEIALAAKTMAKRLNVAVVLMAQLNRGVEGREDKRPNMADLRASGEIEEHADVVGLLYRPAYYLAREANPTNETSEALMREKHRLEFIIGKNRLGPTRSINLWCDVSMSAVDNWRTN